MTRIASGKPHPISVPLKDVLWTANEKLKASSVKPRFGVEINWDYAKRYAA